jgi:predicted transglutaminase-like cysteine proteinase
MLIEASWPREALLLTLVRGADGEGHAVLTVTTDKGDYVVDNMSWISCSGRRLAAVSSSANRNTIPTCGTGRFRAGDPYGNLTVNT